MENWRTFKWNHFIFLIEHCFCHIDVLQITPRLQSLTIDKFSIISKSHQIFICVHWWCNSIKFVIFSLIFGFDKMLALLTGTANLAATDSTLQPWRAPVGSRCFPTCHSLILLKFIVWAEIVWTNAISGCRFWHWRGYHRVGYHSTWPSATVRFFSMNTVHWSTEIG